MVVRRHGRGRACGKKLGLTCGEIERLMDCSGHLTGREAAAFSTGLRLLDVAPARGPASSCRRKMLHSPTSG